MTTNSEQTVAQTEAPAPREPVTTEVKKEPETPPAPKVPTEAELLVKELSDTAAIANTDLDRVDHRSRPSWTAAKREAEEKLGVLRDRYAGIIGKNLLGISLVGDIEKQKAFIKVAKDDAPATAFPVDVRAVYAPIVDAVEEALGSERIFAVTAFVRLRASLYAALEKFEGLPVPELHYPGDTSLPKRSDTEALVSTLIRASGLGDDLLIAAIKRSVFEQAENIRYAETVTPVILVGSLEEEQPALKRLFQHKVVNVHLRAKDVDGETVQKAFTALKNKLKQINKT